MWIEKHLTPNERQTHGLSDADVMMMWMTRMWSWRQRDENDSEKAWSLSLSPVCALQGAGDWVQNSRLSPQMHRRRWLQVPWPGFYLREPESTFWPLGPPTSHREQGNTASWYLSKCFVSQSIRKAKYKTARTSEKTYRLLKQKVQFSTREGCASCCCVWPWASLVWRQADEEEVEDLTLGRLLVLAARWDLVLR